MRINRFSMFSICLLLLAFQSNLYAQLSAYHGILFPYDNPNGAIHSIGDLTYARPDYSSNIQNNPVGTVFFDRPKFFISYNLSISRYEDTGLYTPDFEWIELIDRRRNHKKNSSMSISGLLPFKLFNKRFGAVLSLNKINTPESELYIKSVKIQDLNFSNHREGNVWNCSIGMSCRLPLGIDLGLSWTKWFGSWRWKDENASGRISGEGRYQYDDHVWNFGVQKKIKDISICFIFHTPFTLMKADDVILKLGNTIDNYSLKERFNGAYKIGIDCRCSNQLSLSVGYRHQRQFSMQIVRNSYLEKVKEEYGSSDQISLAGEYVLHFKNLKIPLSIAYWVNWVPKTPDHVPHLKTGEDFFNYYVDYGLSFVDYHSYQFLDIDDDTNLRHNIFIGLNFPFRSFCLYLSTSVQ